MDTQPISPSPAGVPPADVSNTTPAPSAPPIGSGGAGASGAAAREAAIAEATRAAVADFQSGQPFTGKRGNGQRGPDKARRKPRVDRPGARLAGIAPVAGDAGASQLAGVGAAGDPFGLDPEPETPEPILDEKTLRFLAEGLTGLLEDIGTGLVRRVALAETRDAALAKEAAKTAVMSERTRELIVFGAVECAKKYGLETQYGPEACLIGGLGFYAVGIALAVRELRSKPGGQAQASTL